MSKAAESVIHTSFKVDVTFMTSYGQRIDSLKQWDIQKYEDDPATEIVASINLFPIRVSFRHWILTLVLNWWHRASSVLPYLLSFGISSLAFLAKGGNVLSTVIAGYVPFVALWPVSYRGTQIAEYVIRARDKIVADDSKLSMDGNFDEDGEGDERLSLVHRLLRQQRNAKAEDRLTDNGIISEAMAHTYVTLGIQRFALI